MLIKVLGSEKVKIDSSFKNSSSMPFMKISKHSESYHFKVFYHQIIYWKDKYLTILGRSYT